MTLRPELAAPPKAIAKLPVARGYPVPWFVAWLDDDGEPVERGQGTPDFRVVAPGAAARAALEQLCWICGGRMSLRSSRAFVVGPMCAINRISAEPPSHRICATWSARNCPFLTRPTMVRRERSLPEGTVDPAGRMIRRNPGVALVWITRSWELRAVEGGGALFVMGDPVAVEWWAEGREATRAEVEESIDGGLPTLTEMAATQGRDALSELAAMTETARELLPEAA